VQIKFQIPYRCSGEAALAMATGHAMLINESIINTLFFPEIKYISPGDNIEGIMGQLAHSLREM
jgi:hypothetical protein